MTVCSDSGEATECSVMAGEPGVESCNGLDDDCDGNIDETFQALGSVCTVGAGTCLRAGVEIPQQMAKELNAARRQGYRR